MSGAEPPRREGPKRSLTMMRGALFGIIAAFCTSMGHLGVWVLYLLPPLYLAAAFPKTGERAHFFIGAGVVALLLGGCFVPGWYR